MVSISPSPAGKGNLDVPQQVWRNSDDNVMQTALFAGQQMIAVKDDNVGYTLRFLGFQSSPMSSIEQAKHIAPWFARRVMGRMMDMVS